LIFCFLAENNKPFPVYWQFLSSNKAIKHCTFAPSKVNCKTMEQKNDKQRAARRLITEHMQYLADHEQMIERMVDRKWQDMWPKIERTIDRKITEHINK
jgi:hypothetical protein